MTRSIMFALLFAGTLGISGKAAAQASGTLDRLFGEEAGLTATALRDSFRASSVVAMPDGGWVAAGSVLVDREGKLEDLEIPALTRYHADGTRYTSFGTGGAAVSSLQLSISGGTTSVLRDATRLYQVVPDATNVHVLAYTLTGQRDTSYGNGGVATINTVAPNAGGVMYPVFDAVLQNGRVLIAASGRENSSAAGQQFLLARLTTVGQADTTLDTDGKRYYQIYGGGYARNIFTDVTLQADGRIVVAGRARAVGGDYDMVVARLDANGIPDTSFGGSGFRIVSLTDNDNGRRVALQGDGKIVIAGTVCAWVDRQAGESTCFLGAARLRSNGDLDAGFGAGGQVILAVPGPGVDPETLVYGLTTDQQGRFLIMGQTNSPVDGANAGYLVRLANDGSLDTSFGNYGVVQNPYLGEAESFVHAATLTFVPDGEVVQPRLITVGARTPTSGVTEMVIARHIYDNGDVARSARTR